MEDKTFNWFLSECCSRKLRLNILETGICRGSLLLDWFFTDMSGVVVRKVKKEGTRTKHLLSYFLNQRHPVLEEYNPDKVICYLYHKTGVKVVSSKDAIELAENQLHGLQVRSIHMALGNSLNFYKAYRLQAWTEGGELCHKLTYGRIAKEMNEEVNDAAVYEKVLSIIIYISDILAKIQMKTISRIKVDFVVDPADVFYIVKVLELSLDDTFTRSEAIIRSIVRRPTLRQYEESSEEEISIEEPENFPVNLKLLQEGRKKHPDYKMPLKKNKPPNSTVFLEMIAKTFDRDRKVQEHHEKLQNKKMFLEKKPVTNNRKLFQLGSLKQPRENIPKKHAISSVSDLLYYVERTRPRIWLCDVVESKEESAVEVLTVKNRKEGEGKERKKDERLRSSAGFWGIFAQTPVLRGVSQPESPNLKQRLVRPANRSSRITPVYPNLQ